MNDKISRTIGHALQGITDGATVMIGGFGTPGIFVKHVVQIERIGTRAGGYRQAA